MEINEKAFSLDRKIEIIIAIILSACTMGLFFAMSLWVQLGDIYLSDTPAHIDGTFYVKYGLVSVLIYLLKKITSYPLLEFLFAVFETTFVMITWLMTNAMLRKMFSLRNWQVLLISTGLLFLTTFYLPGIYPYFYKYSLGTQPWHNSTFLAMRMGAVIYFYYFFQIYPVYGIDLSNSDWIKMAGSLCFMTMWKPNFFLSIFSSILLLLTIHWFYNKVRRKNIIKMGTTLIPAFVVLMVQYILAYITGNKNGSGVAIVFFSDLLWEGSVIHLLIKFIVPLSFPLLFIFFEIVVEKNNYQKKNILFLLLLYVISIGIFSAFKETGPRENDLNFSWQIPAAYYSMYLLYVPIFFQHMNAYIKQSRSDTCSNNRVLAIYFILGSFLLLYQLICGLVYFTKIISGLYFYQ